VTLRDDDGTFASFTWKNDEMSGTLGDEDSEFSAVLR
jgi:hypothetical protein